MAALTPASLPYTRIRGRVKKSDRFHEISQTEKVGSCINKILSSFKIPGLSPADLRQELLGVLHNALHSFDSKRDVEFATYFTTLAFRRAGRILEIGRTQKRMPKGCIFSLSSLTHDLIPERNPPGVLQNVAEKEAHNNLMLAAKNELLLEWRVFMTLHDSFPTLGSADYAIAADKLRKIYPKITWRDVQETMRHVRRRLKCVLKPQ
jgi:hypothetical protein